jgi:hypothetical protein
MIVMKSQSIKIPILILIGSFALTFCTKSRQTNYPPKANSQREISQDGTGDTRKILNYYPHPKNWALPTNHGVEFAKMKKQETCFVCHKSDRPEGQAMDGSPPKCQACHIAYPHPDNWNGDSDKPEFHGIMGKTSEGNCLACHRNYVDNSPSFDSMGGCKMCHSDMSEVMANECKSKECDVKLQVKWFYVNDGDKPKPSPDKPADEKPSDDAGTGSTDSSSKAPAAESFWNRLLHFHFF